MYRINQLQRNVLIMPDEVIFHAPTGHALDHRQIMQAIIIAEERFIVPALSYDLYQAYAAEKNVIITNANRADLQDTIFQENVSNSLIPDAPTGNEIDNAEVILKVGDVLNSSAFLTSGNLALWNQYLWKLCAECVLLIAMPTAYVQFGTTGVIHAQPGSSAISAAGVTTPSLGAVKWAMDKVMLDRIDPLIYAMQSYICRNKSLFVSYKNICECDNVSNEAKHKRTNFILGIYDSPQHCKCSPEWDQLNGF